VVVLREKGCRDWPMSRGSAGVGSVGPYFAPGGDLRQRCAQLHQPPSSTITQYTSGNKNRGSWDSCPNFPVQYRTISSRGGGVRAAAAAVLFSSSLPGSLRFVLGAGVVPSLALGAGGVDSIRSCFLYHVGFHPGIRSLGLGMGFRISTLIPNP